jgi:hypothetical protein
MPFSPPGASKGLRCMATHVDYLGGNMEGHLILANGPHDEVGFAREIWFDRDIGGHWLVGVTQHHPSGAETTGAIVVQEVHVSAFIELLGKLVAEPGQFADEHVVIGPDWDGRLPARP